MSARLDQPEFGDQFASASSLRPMRTADLAEVLQIERLVYPMPWSEGNFIDSLAAGYEAFVLRRAPVLRDPRAQMQAYFLAMKGVDELHLLNLSVAPEQQGQGLGRLMLDALCTICRAQACPQLWLEVRVGNLAMRLHHAKQVAEALPAEDPNQQQAKAVQQRLNPLARAG